MSLLVDYDIHLGNHHFKLNCCFASTGITGVLGRSGVGKSTLLQAIAGFIDSPSGMVKWRDVYWQQGRKKVSIDRRNIGFVSQHSDLFPHLTIDQNLKYGLKRLTQKNQISMNKRYQELLDLLSLRPLLLRHVDGLSGGEQQKVALARALLSAPELLLMDEPLSAIDEASKPEILYFIRTLCQQYQIPAIYVSHSFDEISYLADDLFLMDSGGHSTPMPIEQVLLDNPNHPALPGPMLVLPVSLINDDSAQGFKEVAWGDHRLKVSPSCGERLRLRSKDITIWSQKPATSSALNLLSAQITEIGLRPASGHCLVMLSLGEQSLFATITGFSVEQMQLSPGQTVYLQIKASSFW